MTEERNNKDNNSDNSGNDYLKSNSEIQEAAIDMLKSGKLFEYISGDIEAIGIAGERQLCLTLYIIMTSRLLDKPLSAIIQGSSSSGKSYTIDTVAKLMPPTEVVQAHDITEQAFYYMPKGSLKHKTVICGERLHNKKGKDGQAKDNSKAFREMVASGVLRKIVTVKKGESFTTEIIEQQGPIAYLESTTATTINDEDATRLLPLVTDESPKQTSLIMESMRQRAKGIKANKEKQNQIIKRHHAMQQLFKPLEVRIPFIDLISLPKSNISTRRTYSSVVSAIKTIAIIRQYQKEHRFDNDIEFIEADEIDYRITYELINPILARTYSGIDQGTLDLFKIIKEKTKRENDDIYEYFTSQNCQKWAGITEPTVRRRLKKLEDNAIIIVNKSSKPYLCKIIEPNWTNAINFCLPTPEQIAKDM